MLKPNFCPILLVLRWTFMAFMDLMHTYYKIGKHLDWLPISYIPTYVLGSKNWDLVTLNCNETQLWPILLVLRWNFMGFMGSYCK